MYSRPRLSPKIAPCPSTITIGSCSGAHHSGMLVNGCQTNCLSVVTKSSVFQSVICSKTRQVTRNVTLKYVSRGQHSGERTRLACPFRCLAEMPLLFNQKRSLARRQRQHARRVRSQLSREQTKVIMADTSPSKGAQASPHSRTISRSDKSSSTVARRRRYFFSMISFSTSKSAASGRSWYVHESSSARLDCRRQMPPKRDARTSRFTPSSSRSLHTC